jgi:5-methylcytosine-specific restriction enzyme B
MVGRSLAVEAQSTGMAAVLNALLDGPVHRLVIKDIVEKQLQPDEELREQTSNGIEKWWNYVTWGSTTMSKVGWITKDGSGNWQITGAGRSAAAQFTATDALRREANRLYAEWRKSTLPPTRRAWLIRGSSVRGANLVHQWLGEGWCSLAASQLPEVDTTTDKETLVALAEDAYAHLKHHERTAKIAELVDFMTRMNVGDVVLTTGDAGDVYVGDVTGIPAFTASEESRSNLRRTVDWRNPDDGIDFASLPGSLQAKLKTGSTLADITGEVVAIDELTTLGVEDDDGPEAISSPELRRPHERLEPLPAEVADDLLVSEAWLNDVVELLNEKRQLVFYGPPGTGKTFLARRIAAQLVGEQQVRLVQFHPSYTYEDFFEGFRPAADSKSGTVSLELRAGPLRRLASEATEHADQAFILVIDELNRANIAKVFGELYFLLEYRDQAVEVLYGGEPFTLPTNLYFVCTMNTADRSIALLDAAMRRRFAFVELHPATEPTASTLTQWLERHELPAESGVLLALLNAALDDREAHIGPSYFMVADQSKERLSRIWRTQIVPLLQETHYDRWSSVASKFEFEMLYAKAATALEQST